MRPLVSSLQRKSENYHMLIHALLGVAAAYFILSVFPEAPKTTLVIYGVLGGLLPDIDHFIYYFFYGKNSQYAQIAKYFILKKQLRNWAKFVKTNHKQNTGLYSHNFISLLLSVSLFVYFGLRKDHPGFAVFALSWSIHYLFDIFEDLLFFRRLNPNWYLKFNRNSPNFNLLNLELPFFSYPPENSGYKKPHREIRHN
jgi:hypothetical protein